MKTITAASNNSTPSPWPSNAIWLSRFRTAKGYGTAVRVLGVTWFLTLALAAALKVVTHAQALTNVHFSPVGWSALLSSVCLFLFYLALGWAMLLRPAPVARSDRLLPSFIAFVGTYLPWTIVLFGPVAASASQNAASAALLLTGTVSMVVVIFHLGRSFSIVPQARRLVRTGPYSIVRNPLYLVEEVALLGTLLQFYSPATLLLLLVHAALQFQRIFYEENLLRRTFPEYDEYAKSTSRLIPHVW